MSDYTTAPMVACPVCRKQFQEDESWELDAGSEIFCQFCDARLQCTEVETTRWWAWEQARNEEGR